MKNNKGLSNIVGTVLIVLLALAAVAIVWSFINPIFGDTENQVSILQECLSTELRPTICVIDSDTNETANITVVSAKGEAKRMKLLIEDANDVRIVGNVSVDAPDGELESTTKQIIGLGPLDNSSSGIPWRAQVVPVLIDNQGKEANCDPSQTVIECTFS